MSDRKLNRLTPDLLLRAYTQGYFPMPDPDTDEIVWLRPKKRALIPLQGFHASRSLLKAIRKGNFRVSYDCAFQEVMAGCAEREETWITEEFIRAYTSLFELGYAHSVEVWEGEALVGGVYGVSIGGAFFAESKFHRTDNASKIALYYLVEHLNKRDFQLLEVQFLTQHLASLGAREVPDEHYQLLLRSAVNKSTTF